MKIVFGTTNQRKIEDLKKLIKILDLDLEVLGLDDIDWNLGEINEDGHTIEENSLIKARAIYNFCNEHNINYPIITDDAGLFCDALNGEPGVFTVRYADIERANDISLPKYQCVIKLLKKLENVDNRVAYYRACVTLMMSDGSYSQEVGESRGYIAKDIIGELKKPYFYAVFVLDKYNKVFSSLEDNELLETYRYEALKKILLKIKIVNKIAVISDVHGNYEALKRVLDDIKKREIKKIICLGDVIGKGNYSNKCLNLLKNNLILYGNWEEFFNKKMYTHELAKKRYDILESEISLENKKRLKTLPFSYEIYISGRLVRFFHASPNDAWKNVLEIDRIDRLYEQFLPSSKTGKEVADIVVYGHTHMQNMMKLYNRTLINVGSVGNAFDLIRNEKKDGSKDNTTNADYLIIEGVLNSKENDDIRFEFVSLKYDNNLELANNGNNIEKELYEKEILEGRFRNLKKYEENFKDAKYDIEMFL